MGKKLEALNDDLVEFIKQQKIFFVGTAAEEGFVNVSPKGSDSFRILNHHKIAWLNLTGSGNETAAHILKNNRMTIMFCSFDQKPLILRLYGKANIYHERDQEFQDLENIFPNYIGKRQIITLDIHLVQTSCGFAVPLMNFQEERMVLDDWANKKGRKGIEEYWRNKNQISIDGFETGIF